MVGMGCWPWFVAFDTYPPLGAILRVGRNLRAGLGVQSEDIGCIMSFVYDDCIV